MSFSESIVEGVALNGFQSRAMRLGTGRISPAADRAFRRSTALKGWRI